MAVIANTFQTTSAVGNREQLSNIVEILSPEDTPIYSLARKMTLTGKHPEWETDALDPPAQNAQLEGDEYAFNAVTPPLRMGTYTQIMRRSGIISGTQDAENNTGSVETVRGQKVKKGKTLKLDVEYAIVTPHASVGGATRFFGSLDTWIKSNVSRGAGGANGGYNSGTGLTVVPTNGTQRAFTKTIMDSVMQQGYQSGANFRHLVVSPYVKSVFVTIMSDANVAAFRTAVSDGKGNSMVANADIYEGPFGKVTVMPNRVMSSSAGAARNAYFIDPDYLKFGWFRRIHEDKEAGMAKTGDAKKFVLIGEGALCPSNEAGLGVAADLFGLTATT